jgi:hypothetical protein
MTLFNSPLERSDKTRKRKDSTTTDPPHIYEKLYFESMYNLPFKKVTRRKIEIFVKIIEPGGAFERISWKRPMIKVAGKPAPGPKKRVMYMIKGMPTSGLKNSTGKKERIADSKIMKIILIRIYEDVFISFLQ